MVRNLYAALLVDDQGVMSTNSIPPWGFNATYIKFIRMVSGQTGEYSTKKYIATLLHNRSGGHVKQRRYTEENRILLSSILLDNAFGELW